MEDLRSILSYLEKYKQNLKQYLSMPLLDYEKVVPDAEDGRPGWERLEDDLRAIEVKSKLKKLYNEFPPSVKKVFSKATDDQIEELARASATLEKIEKKKEVYNPNTDKVETVSAWRAFCFGIGKYADTITYPRYKDAKVAIDDMIKEINDHTKRWDREEEETTGGESRIVKDIKALGAQVGVFYAKDGYIAISVRSPKASNEFCNNIVNTTMCIKDEYRFWSYGEGKIQFMFVNENLPDSSKYYMNGLTVDKNEKITAMFDRHNVSLVLPNGTRPSTLLQYLEGMKYPEPLIRSVMKNFQEEVRIKLALENFFKSETNMKDSQIIGSLISQSRSAITGYISEKDWKEISAIVSEVIFKYRDMKKSQFLKIFRESGILSEASLRVFDALVGDEYTNDDIKTIMEVTKEVIEDIRYLLEISKDSPKSMITGGNTEDLKKTVGKDNNFLEPLLMMNCFDALII